MHSLVSPQSYPHLWKKLWKNARNHNYVSIQGLIHADFGGGETPEGRPDGLFQGADAARLWKIRLRREAKARRRRFFLE
jgi:hypothetical protein